MKKNNMIKNKIENLYAVHHGDYAGQLFAFINETDSGCNFLSMPEMKNIEVPKKAFDEGLKKDLVKFVENLPEDIFKVVKAQYEKNSNN